MNKTNVVIIEEPVLGQKIKEALQIVQPDWKVELLPASIKDAVQWFCINDPTDILFVDTNLIDGNPFRLFERVRIKGVVIFISDTDKYALQAFSIDCLDYLVKPFTSERLEQTVLKYMRLIGYRHQDIDEHVDLPYGAPTFRMENKKYRTRVLVASKTKFIPIEVDDISYFFSQNRITYVTTFDGSRYTIDLPLSQLETELKPDCFYRINRQYILSAHAISKIEPFFNKKYTVTLKPEGETNIIVGCNKIAALKNWLDY